MALSIWATARTSLQVGTSIYAQGDALGVKTALAVPPRGIVVSAIITDIADLLTVDTHVWCFDSEPAGIAANSAFALADADLEKSIGLIVLNSHHDAINGRMSYESQQSGVMGLPYNSPDGFLWVQVELEGSLTPTFATDDVKLKLFIEY